MHCICSHNTCQIYTRCVMILPVGSWDSSVENRVAVNFWNWNKRIVLICLECIQCYTYTHNLYHTNVPATKCINTRVLLYVLLCYIQQFPVLPEIGKATSSGVWSLMAKYGIQFAILKWLRVYTNFIEQPLLTLCSLLTPNPALSSGNNDWNSCSCLLRRQITSWQIC